MRLVASAIPAGSHLVRICRGDGPEYDRMIVVTEDGDALRLMGWIGAPLTPAEWRAAAAELFPAARRVCFERRRGRRVAHVEMRI